MKTEMNIELTEFGNTEVSGETGVSEQYMILRGSGDFMTKGWMNENL